MDALVKMFARNVYEDMLSVAELVRASDLDWTIVRIPMLTDQPKTGQVKVAWVGKGMRQRLPAAAWLLSSSARWKIKTYMRRWPAVSN